MRLQVFLSHSRVCSRRKALELIQQGRVSVNGEIVKEPSYQVDGGSARVSLDDKEVTLKEFRYLLLHKPPGVVTTLQDKHAKRTVADLLPARYKDLYPVGRLDKDSEGLLLFTNDGALTFRLLHPSFKVDKAYFVEITGHLQNKDKERLEKGIVLEGRRTYPAHIKVSYAHAHQSGFIITLHEGRKRQIRLMLGSVGYQVRLLRRIRYGPLSLGDVQPGKWRLLEEKEVESLRKACGLG